VTPEAEELNERGRELADAGRLADAEAAYRSAIARAPEWSVPAYNLGLLLKYQRRWPESLAANRRAAELAPDDQAAWWNLGIAATALGEWPAAREAWTRCGLTPPPGDGAPRFDFGMVPIRLNPDADGEVVWADRIDPARAVLRSIPLARSGFRWRDVVLHDGAAVGHRMRQGREVPVFNALDRLDPSPFSTYELEVALASRDDFDALSDAAERAGGAAEHWGQTVTYLCRACSEGTPHGEHDDIGAAGALPCAVAALTDAHLDQIVETWRRVAPGARVLTRRLTAAPGRPKPA
jgi:tetratricopeptide (TPR) repeat protein